jgi:hypothetical protein
MNPPTSEEWDLNSDGFSEGVAVLVGGVCPVGADGFRFACTTTPGTDPETSIQADATCANPAVIGGFEPEDTINGWIRWLSGSDPVSDWSEMKTVPIS